MAKDMIKSLNKRNCKKAGLTYCEAAYRVKEHFDYSVGNKCVCWLIQDVEGDNVTLTCGVNQSLFGMEENPYTSAWQEQVNKLFEKFQGVAEIDRQELAETLQDVLVCLNKEWQAYNQDRINTFTQKFEAELAKIKGDMENPWFLKK